MDTTAPAPLAASPSSRLPAWKIAVLRLVLTCLVLQPVAASAQVVAAAAGAGQPQVGAALNGVPLVQIAAPNGSGVSHNQYQQFNVGTPGVVLNNSQVAVQTQLAGYVEGNANLAAGPARIILNEVTSTQPSNLNGYLEVAGTRAEVVIANPNGITCNGCGFINTSRGVLATGAPLFGADGALDALRVTGGTVAFQGSGLNAANTDQVDIVARSVQVNAELWARKLNVVAGANRVNYADLGVQLIAGTGDIPTVAIDVAAIGGMYAGKIRLVGTEAGVGVASAGNIAAQSGDLVIDSRGKVTLRGNTTAAGDIAVISSGDIDNSGSLYAGGNAGLTAQGRIDNSGTLAAQGNLELQAAAAGSAGLLAAGIGSDGTLGTTGRLVVASAGSFVAAGQLLAGGDLDIEAAAIDLAGTATAARGKVSLSATAGDLRLDGALLQAGGSATLTTTGTISNRGGEVEAGGALDIRAAALDNTGGRIASLNADGLTIATTGLITNAAGSFIGGNGRVAITAGSLVNSADIVAAGSDTLTISAASLANTGGSIVSNGALDIAGDTVSNDGGTLYAAGNLGLTATTLTNLAGLIMGGGDVRIAASLLDNRQQGAILAGRDLLLDITTAADNSGGSLFAGRDLVFDQAGAGLQNAGGNLGADGNLRLNLASLANQGGTVGAANDIALSLSGSLSGIGSIVAGRDADIDLAGDFTLVAGNRIKANRHLALAVAGSFANEATLEAGGDLGVTAAVIDNRAGATLRAGNVALVATGALANAGRIEGDNVVTGSATLVNTGTIIGDNLLLAADSLENRGGGAVIAATTSIGLRIADRLANLDGATIYSGGDLAIAADAGGAAMNTLVNEGSAIEAAGDLAIAAKTIENRRKSVTLSSVTVSSSSGSVIQSIPGYSYYDSPRHTWNYTTSETRADSMSPEARILAGGAMTLTADTLTNAYSTIAAGGDLQSTVGSLTNLAATLTRTTYTYDEYWCAFPSGGWCPGHGNHWWDWHPVYTDTVVETIGSVPAVFSSNASFTGVSVAFNNLAPALDNPVGGMAATLGAHRAAGSVAAAAALTGTPPTPAAPPAPTLPSSGLYRLHAEPNHPYLVETDPRFADYGNFLGSDYMLSRLALDPQATHKRLGDGFYEQKLVTDQVLQLTGRRHLEGYADTQAAFRALMDAGVATAGTLNLAPGIALTAAQVAALSADIVWMVEQEVALPSGLKERALVPVVYLAPAHADLKPDGAVVAAADIDLTVASLLDNSGTIRSDGSLNLAAADLVNRAGLIRAGDDAHIDVANDLLNLSGTIRGRTLDIAAGRDILNATAVARLVTATTDTAATANGGTTTIGRRTQAEDLAGVRGAFVADAGLGVSAGRDLTLAGGTASAGGDADFAAGRHLALSTQAQESRSEQSFAFGSANRSERIEIASAVEAGGRFSATAGADLTVAGSTASAGTSLAASAGNALSVVAVAESSSGGTSLDQGRSGGSAQYRTDTLRSSTLAAGQDLSLSAGTAQTADLTVAASRLTAGNDAALAASRNVVVASMAETSSLSASNWGARDNASTHKESASAVGSVVQAGNDLAVTTAGSLVVEGSALDAGRNLEAQVAGDLQLLAATSTRRESVQSSRLTRRQAESLSFELDQNRQLLSTITAGSGVDLQVGGNVVANVGTKDGQGALQADRMTAAGVVKGTDRQQVSVGGSGSTAGVSQVLGSLAGQGIRNGANDAFAATATKEGQAAVSALLQSGLVGIRNHPDLQAILATPNGTAVTYKDDSGKVQLTLAGQAKVQEVYSALRLTETFDVRKFADPGLGQVVTLVAAIALTATSGGAGAAFLGAAQGTVSAAMANAAFTSMASTMIGQMASGASLGDALAAGLRAAASSALTAGILNAPIIDGPKGLQSLNQWAGIQDVAGTGAKLARGDWSNLGQTAAGIGLRGVVNAGVNTAIYGGSFGTGFKQSLVSDVGAIATNVVGQAFAFQRGAGNAGYDEGGVLHSLTQAAVGGTTQALLTGGDKGRAFLSGAVGAGVSAAAGDLLTKARGGDTAQAGLSALVGAGIAGALGLDGLAAANAAMNETLNNRRSPKVQMIVEGARSCQGEACVRTIDVLRQEQARVAAEQYACNAAPAGCSAEKILTLKDDAFGLASTKAETIRRGIAAGLITTIPTDYFEGIAGIGLTGTGVAFTRVGGRTTGVTTDSLGTAAKEAAGATTVIGRVKDLQKLDPGEKSLLDRLPDLGNPKANWQQNAGVLREEMRRNLPIRDASPGDTAGQFLNAERGLLRNRGWTFDPQTNFWMPPKP
ncbi:MAG: filamentous hemagglutinin N-terminal domain-containing protein [Sterolibacteriaceae bacterium MAG5]|nr:filamentous hemagglutinin N-terminal domain-containing protein [Candidatus Nitricoxidireducens bremensis]